MLILTSNHILDTSAQITILALNNVGLRHVKNVAYKVREQ